jgi:hypothetical protein
MEMVKGTTLASYNNIYWNIPAQWPVAGDTPAVGQYSFIPQGLGMLLEANSLPDGRVFLCPSMNQLWQVTCGDWPSLKIFRPDVWQILGGSDRDHLTTPANDPAKLVSPAGSYTYNFGAITSSYQYRNMPFVVHSPYLHPNYDNLVQILGVKPVRYGENGCPMFKTQKMLAGRAIVLDTIDNINIKESYLNGLPSDLGGVKGGAVRFHHQDGYNVLYGDYHTAWYGDPNKTIAYIHNGGYYNSTYTYWGVVANLCSVSFSAHPSYQSTEDTKFIQAQQVWNLFDKSAGIDQ